MSVSVIMAAYNAERFISQAIESVLQQTHSDFELIVVDDGSTDETANILEQYQKLDPRVRVLPQDNRGASAARNAAATAAKANWLALIDADDVAEPEWLERQIFFVESHDDLAVASCLLTYINESGGVIGKGVSDLISDSAVEQVRQNGDIIVISNSGPLIRREVFERLGGYRDNVWPAEDLDLYNRIADSRERVLVNPEHLVRYRIHPNSATGVTSGWDGSLQGWIRECSLQRRKGLPEPTWYEFVHHRRNLRFYQRMNLRRLDTASILYRKATYAYSLGQVGWTVLLILGSSILDPFRAPLQVWRKFSRN